MEKCGRGMKMKRRSKQADDEIDMGQDHPAAAVPRETKVIKCVPVVLIHDKKREQTKV